MGQTKTLITAEQLPAIAGDRRVELVDGELVSMSPVGLTHAWVVGRFTHWLESFVGEKKLGRVGPELGCVLRRNPDVVRAPDVCFIASGRLRGINQEGYFEGAPDLAIEVLSPDDTASAMQEKMREYLAAGARLVWFADPRT
ncbi:MAG: Uma2 family endonuclease, partial [Gammaproteobacteria bacterium]